MPRGKATTAKNKAARGTARNKNTGDMNTNMNAGASGGTGRKTLAAINKQFRELPQQQQHKFLISSLGTVLTSTGSGNKSSAATS